MLGSECYAMLSADSFCILYRICKRRNFSIVKISCYVTTVHIAKGLEFEALKSC